MIWQLTPGQERVRQLATELLPQFPRINATDKEPVYDMLLNALKGDPTIRNDPITSLPLGQRIYADNYLSWLKSISIAISTPGTVHFDRVVLFGSVIELWKES